MQKLKSLFLVVILAFVGMSAYAQSKTVTGKVVDNEGYEVIGGSVTVKGAAGVGTVTDINGNYSLQVNDAFNPNDYFKSSSPEGDLNIQSTVDTSKAGTYYADYWVTEGSLSGKSRLVVVVR